MSSIPYATVPDEALCAGAAGESRRFRLGVRRLRKGMFVAELDRPWLDTPFLLQGFLADSDIELTTLQRYCRYVYVDLERSAPELAHAIRSAGEFVADHEAHDHCEAPRPAPIVAPVTHHAGSKPPAARDGPTPAREADAQDTLPLPGMGGVASSPEVESARSYRLRADVRITRETRERFRSLARGKPVSPPTDSSDTSESLTRRALSRLRGLFGTGAKSGERNADADRALPAALCAEIRALLPPGTATASHHLRHDATLELPRARRAFAMADHALARLLADVRGGSRANLELVLEAVEQLVTSLVDNPDALQWVAQMREENRQPGRPGARVALYLILFGRHLGLPRPVLSTLGTIGMLADIGKARLPQALLEKPRMLNPAEFSIVKEHVRLGLEALSCLRSLPPEVELGIAQHHERMDGSGYPKGLVAGEISLFGRMAGIADSFAALSAPRAYANPLAAQDALMNLYQWADTSFDGPLVEQFVQAVGVFPVGSMVELSTGEVAVVAAHNPSRRLEPRVLLLATAEKRPLQAPLEVDLMDLPRRGAEKPVRVIRGLASGAYGLNLRDYYADGPVATAG